MLRGSPREGSAVSTTGHDTVIDHLDTLANEYGNRFLLEPAPDNELPENGMRAVDAMRLIGEELVLDGFPMRNLATFVTTWMEPEAQRHHRGEPPPQLHRPRRVSADRGDRAALHPHARRPLPRARRDHRCAHAGVLRGDHAGRAVAQVEVARRAASRRARPRTGRTSCSAGTCTWSGRSSAATSTSSRGSSRCSPTSTRSGPRTWSRTSTRTRSAWPPCSGTTFTGHSDDIVGINDLLVRLKHDKGLDVPLHVDGASGGFVWPFLYPDSRMGLPARAGALDQRLRPQVRARLSRASAG